MNTHCEWVFGKYIFVMKKEKEIAQFALDYAMKNGCQQARVLFSAGEENEVEVRDGKINKLHHSGGCQLSLSLFVDGAYSTISTNRLERGELERFIDKGVIGTRFLAKDPYRSLPEKEMYYKGEMNDFGLYDEDFQKIDVDAKIAVARDIYEEIDDERVISVMAGVADAETYNYLVDSNGFEGEKSRTLYMATAQVSVLGEGDERPEDFVYVNAQYWNRLQKSGVGAEALKRTIDKIGASRVDSGVYDIVVDRRVASSLISPLVSALRGESLHMKSSFLLDQKGEKIGSDKLTIMDNPRQFDKAGARLFDNEGIAVEGMSIVENGVLNNYYISNYMSKKMGEKMTQGNPTILDFELGEMETAELVRNLNRGLYITGFNGGNCNGTTGDFSYGIEGYWVENGVIVKPVSEMLMTGNMLSLWNSLANTSNDPLGYSAWKVPSLLFEGVVLN